jgi:multiple sugar transport system permease protein
VRVWPRRLRNTPARFRLRSLLLAMGGGVTATYFLAPFCWLILTSFMNEREALSIPPHWLPSEPTLANYQAFFDPDRYRPLFGSRAAENTLPAIRNSLVAASAATVLAVTLGTLAGYSIARLRFPGRRALVFVYLGSRMVPGIALVIPLYLLMQSLGLLDTLLALVLTYLALTLPVTVWLLASYFRGVPRELEDAALVDGCSRPRMVLLVLLPVARPGLAAAAIFAFMTAWSDFVFSVILTSTMASKTAPTVVSGLAVDALAERTLLTAGGVLAVIPPLLLALALQRLIVYGLASGSLKG